MAQRAEGGHLTRAFDTMCAALEGKGALTSQIYVVSLLPAIEACLRLNVRSHVTL